MSRIWYVAFFRFLAFITINDTRTETESMEKQESRIRSPLLEPTNSGGEIRLNHDWSFSFSEWLSSWPYSSNIFHTSQVLKKMNDWTCFSFFSHINGHLFISIKSLPDLYNFSHFFRPNWKKVISNDLIAAWNCWIYEIRNEYWLLFQYSWCTLSRSGMF